MEQTYFFITARGVFEKMAEAKKDMRTEGAEEFLLARREGKVVKRILARCPSAKVIVVHFLPCKGLGGDGHVVKLVCDDPAQMGHMRVIAKCDSEPAAKKVIVEALIRAEVDVKKLETISQDMWEKAESQSNGMTDVRVKISRGHFRTLRSLHAAATWCGTPSWPPDRGMAYEPCMPPDQRYGPRR